MNILRWLLGIEDDDGKEGPLEPWKRRYSEKKQRLEQEERERKWAEENRQYTDDLAEHMRTFSCQIGKCKVRTTGPVSYYDTTYDKWKTAWEVPKNLYQCDTCGKWACHKHIVCTDYIPVQRVCICAECAEKE